LIDKRSEGDDEMLDTHLIYEALAAFGMAAALAILVSVAIVTVAAIRHNRTSEHGTLDAVIPSTESLKVPALR